MKDEEKIEKRIVDVLLDYPDGYTNKTIERLIDIVYWAQSRKRTSAQNRGLHKDCAIVAEKLNDAGYDVKKVIKVDIPFTTTWVKEYIWRPIQIKMFKKESTRELNKSEGEFEQIHNVMMRELGRELGIEDHEFPHDKKKKKEWEESVIGNYPTENDDPEKVPF